MCARDVRAFLSVCLSVCRCLFVCLPASLPLCLSVRLPVCRCLFVCLRASLPLCLSAFLSTCLSAFFFVFSCTFLYHCVFLPEPAAAAAVAVGGGVLQYNVLRTYRRPARVNDEVCIRERGGGREGGRQ